MLEVSVIYRLRFAYATHLRTIKSRRAADCYKTEIAISAALNNNQPVGLHDISRSACVYRYQQKGEEIAAWVEQVSVRLT